MKLYTRTGDDGSTGLFGGDRVGKDHPRVRAYGAVDELNASLGLAAAACPPTGGGTTGSDTVLGSRFPAILAELQSRLFDVGADLATPAGSKHADKIARLDDTHVAGLEAVIDEVESGNAPMTSFVLPGGTELAARLHLARTLCRRAEREIVTLTATDEVTPAAIVYLNRVSDLLFAMARRANREAGCPDVPWVPGQPGE